MSIHQQITAAPAFDLAGMLALIDARSASASAMIAEANRIADEAFPDIYPDAHGFYDPAGFLRNSRQFGNRTALFNATLSQLQAMGGAL